METPFFKLDNKRFTFGTTGIVETDETFILESKKGNKKLSRKPRKRGGKASKRGLSKQQVCILVARDRSGQAADFVTGGGSVSAEILASTLEPLLSNDALLVSDGAPAYKCFARENNITHEVINASKKERVRGTYHIQNVNGYHGRFKKWIDRFNGVATKYLDDYLGWRRTLEKYPKLTS